MKMQCERCKEILRYGGMGHTMSIHSENQDVILEFGLRKPAYRIVVNTPTTHGAIGLTTGLDPAMTLGCGGFGGNITSDNISPKHLLNIKRLAWEIRPANSSRAENAGDALPRIPAPVPHTSLDAASVTSRIEAITSLPHAGKSANSSANPVNQSVAEFVCEEDVRTAIKLGRTITINERTIVTPAARDAAEAGKVFVYANWRG